MTRMSTFIVIAAALAVSARLSSSAAKGHPDLEKAANAFMDAYVAGDWKRVESLLTRGKLYVYGSDLSEFSSDRAGFKAIFDNDQALWKGGAHFGAMSNISSVQQGDVATLFFNRVFEVGGQRVTVRFATVWRSESGAWKFVQSSNTVATVGQSAAEILAHPHQ